jgi:hypothetical protein
MRASRDALPSLRSRLSRTFPLLAVALVAGLGRAPLAAAETWDVGCDVFTLAGVLNVANRNGEEDLIWLSPPCKYDLLSPLVVEADLGNPIRIYGRGATIDGREAHRVLEVSAGAILDLHGVTLTRGQASDRGGAIRNLGTLFVTDSSVRRSGANVGGGGIYNAGRLRMVRSTLADNAAVLEGGGIENAAGTLTLIDTSLVGNLASYGGGLFNRSTASLYNSSVLRNGALNGGGIFNQPAARTLLGNVTISSNEVSVGGGAGGIRNEGALAIDNTIVANTRFGEADCTSVGTITATGGNLVEDGSCAIPGALSGDPLLLDAPELLTADGGRPPVLPLLALSAAVDAGHDASCPGHDQTGLARPLDGDRDGTAACDLGASETACGLLGIELFLVLPLARRFVRARAGVRVA